jgi:predicted kinase
MKILMLRGLVASGKTTFAKELVEKDSSYVRVNKDDIRAMLGTKWSDESEKQVIKIRDSIIENFLLDNKNVIVDDTNFSSRHEKILRQIADNFKVDFEIKDFDTPIWDC